MRTDDYCSYIGDSTEIPGFEPCPFCGETNLEVFETGSFIGAPSSRDFAVECVCGARLDSSCRVYPYENAEANVIEAAKREWNRRA
jgi:hypothetical protein